MKFNIIALAGVLASANAHQLRHQLRTNVRKLEGAYRADLDGSANISFAKCIEVTVQPDDDYASAIQGGTAKPVKSYAAFYINDYADDNEMMMVSLGEYVAAKVQASAMKSEKACEVCREYEDTCGQYANQNQNANQNYNYGDEEEADEEQDANEEQEADEADDGEGRKLAVAVDSSFCSECQANGCYDENENNGQVEPDQQLAEFIEEVANCYQVNNYQDSNGNYAYIGLACGSHGDAAEFAVFLDDKCTIETNEKSATKVLEDAGVNDQGVSMSQILSFSSWYMQEAFTTSLSCEQVEYYDPNDEDANANGDNQNGYEMSEVCEQITGEAVYIADCAAQEANEEDEENEEGEQWYDFDVQDGGDIEEVCAIVNYKMNAGEDFDYFYNEKKQGTSYKRTVTGSLKQGNGMSGWLIFLIVVSGLFMCFYFSTMRNSKVRPSDDISEALTEETETEDEPVKNTSYNYKFFFSAWSKKMKYKLSRH